MKRLQGVNGTEIENERERKRKREREREREREMYLIISSILLSLLHLIPASKLLASFFCVCQCVNVCVCVCVCTCARCQVYIIDTALINLYCVAKGENKGTTYSLFSMKAVKLV